MDCEDLRTRVAPLLDGELGPAEEQLVGEHLEHCGACAEFVEQIAAQDLVPPGPDPRTSKPEFWTGMDAAIDDEWHRIQAASPSTKPRLWKRNVSIAAPVLVAMAATLLLSIGVSAYALDQADEARATTAQLSQELERERRLAATPAEPVQVDAFNLATYTPHRGTF